MDGRPSVVCGGLAGVLMKYKLLLTDGYLELVPTGSTSPARCVTSMASRLLCTEVTSCEGEWRKALTKGRVACVYVTYIYTCMHVHVVWLKGDQRQTGGPKQSDRRVVGQT